jgi:hypothetical protein
MYLSILCTYIWMYGGGSFYTIAKVRLFITTEPILRLGVTAPALYTFITTEPILRLGVTAPALYVHFYNDKSSLVSF